MARKMPEELRAEFGVEGEDAPKRRAGSREDLALQRIRWAMLQRRPCQRRELGIAINAKHEVQLSMGSRRKLGLHDGQFAIVGWDDDARQAVIEAATATDIRAGMLRHGGYLGRSAGKFLETVGFVPGVFYPGEVRDGALVVPLPTPQAAGGGRAES